MSLGVPRVASMAISFARPLFRLVTTRMYIYRWLAGYLILRVGFGLAAGSQPKSPGTRRSPRPDASGSLRARVDPGPRVQIPAGIISRRTSPVAHRHGG